MVRWSASFLQLSQADTSQLVSNKFSAMCSSIELSSSDENENGKKQLNTRCGRWTDKEGKQFGKRATQKAKNT